MSDVTVTTEPPAPNTAEARTADGTLKPVSQPSTTPSPEPTPTDSIEPEGNSFLTKKASEAPPKEGDTPPKPEGEKKTDAAVGAPEKYGDFKLPDGYKFDEAELGKATAIFKDLNLSQDQAQRLVDHYAENSLQASRAPFDYWSNMQKEWNTEISSRFGARTDQVRSDINKAIDAVLPPSLAKGFRAGLDLTGAGTHPDLVEGLSLLLKPHFEGTPVRGNGPTEVKAPGQSEKPSLAESIYPHLIRNRPQ